MAQTPKPNFLGEIVVYSILGCPHCMKTKQTLKDLDLPFTDVRLDKFPHIRDDVIKKSGVRTVPQIYFNEVFIGGNVDFQKLVEDKSKLKEMIEKLTKNKRPSNSGVIIPDPSTATEETDPFIFQCEPDEYFQVMHELERDGVIKEQGNFFQTKKRGFTGKEFLQWVKAKKKEDEVKAVDMGQALLDRKFIKSSKESDLKFSLKDDLYTLIQDEKSDALNNGPLSSCAPQSANEVGNQMRKLILLIYGKYLSSDGKAVDYKGIKSSSEFETYKKLTKELLRVEIEKATREEKVSFFINIYNALVIHANVEKGPPTNLWARYKFFNNSSYIIGTLEYNLQDIENGVLRANRKGVGQISKPFSKDDPRLAVSLKEPEPLIHFGLVCGAKSCPPIKTYSAQNIYNELKLAAQAFLDNDDGCIVDVKNNTVKLSSIFNWYMEDFGKDKAELLKFVEKHMAPGKKKDDIKAVQDKGNFKVSFLKYDWSVNSKS